MTVKYRKLSPSFALAFRVIVILVRKFECTEGMVDTWTSSVNFTYFIDFVHWMHLTHILNACGDV